MCKNELTDGLLIRVFCCFLLLCLLSRYNYLSSAFAPLFLLSLHNTVMPPCLVFLALSSDYFFNFYLPLVSKSFSSCCLQWLPDGYFLCCFLSYLSCLPVILELFLYTDLGAFLLFLYFRNTPFFFLFFLRW